MLMWSRRRHCALAKPFCTCLQDGIGLWSMDNPGGCRCGEHANIQEWIWEKSPNTEMTWVLMTRDQKQVTFHPFYSSGTAMVKGNNPLLHGNVYYWEIKMLSEPYGTDVMVGIGTDKVDQATSRYHFTSLLGSTEESYGFSYTGALRHNGSSSRDGPGFCKGTIVGVKVDLWHGTLEFFVNRISKGHSFYNLRRHQSGALFPMISSTAAQSCMRLIYTGSWQASLLVNAAKILGASVKEELNLPPGLKNMLKKQFWMTLPNTSYVLENGEKESQDSEEAEALIRSTNYEDLPLQACPARFSGYYTDSANRVCRVALIHNSHDVNFNNDPNHV